MAKRAMSKREKTILGLTVFVGLAALLWIGYIEGFIEEYQGVSSQLVTARKTFTRQRAILDKGSLVEEAYAGIEAGLPPTAGNKRPEMQFTEEIARIFAQLGLESPSISPHREEEVPGAQDFVYIVLPITGIKANLDGVTKLLKTLYDRNLQVQKIRIESSGAGREQLSVTLLEVARLVQTRDLGAAQPNVVKRR